MTAEGSTHPGPAQEATELGPFRLHERARGPFAVGEAFRATDTRAQSAAVVTTFGGDPERVLADAELLREASHRALPSVLESGVEGRAAWLATTPIGGLTLAEVVGPSGRVAPMLAVRLIGEIADALERLHGVGLVHGQVSPEAILVRQHPVERPVLGMLRLGDGEVVSEAATPYRAPEVSSGGPATEASDHYSLSLVLREALTGRSGDGLPGGLESVFEAALASDPGRRASSQDVVSETARALMSGQVPAVPREAQTREVDAAGPPQSAPAEPAPAPAAPPVPERAPAPVPTPTAEPTSPAEPSAQPDPPEPAASPSPAAGPRPQQEEAPRAEPRPAPSAPERREAPRKRTGGLLGALGLSIARPGSHSAPPESPSAPEPRSPEPRSPEPRSPEPPPRPERPREAPPRAEPRASAPSPPAPSAPPRDTRPPAAAPPPRPPAEPPPAEREKRPAHPEQTRQRPDEFSEQGTPVAPPQRKRPRVGAIALGLLLIALFGLAGFLLGSGTGDEPAAGATERAEAGDVSLDLPSAWKRGDTPPRGLAVADPVSAQARGGTLNAGTIESDGPLFPSQTARKVIGNPRPDGSVRLGKLSAYRFTGGRVTLFLAPTTNGLVAVSCTGDRAFLPACQRAAATLSLDGDARPASLAGLGAYAARADRAIDALVVTRRRYRRALRRAKTRGGQARIARRIARADRSTSRRLSRGVPQGAQRQVTSLRRALDRAAQAYTVLARAKTRRGYGRASRQVRAAERQINRALARL